MCDGLRAKLSHFQAYSTVNVACFASTPYTHSSRASFLRAETLSIIETPSLTTVCGIKSKRRASQSIVRVSELPALTCGPSAMYSLKLDSIA